MGYLDAFDPDILVQFAPTIPDYVRTTGLKMISPQNIATGVSVTDLKGKEGLVVARTFLHSVVLTLVLVVIVIIQQYLVPQVIPAFVAK